MRKLIFRERLELIRKFLKKDWQDLAEDFGTSPSGMSAWRTGKAHPNFDRVCTFAESHPEIDGNWLLTGEGNMIRDSKELIKNLQTNQLIDDTNLKKEIQKIWGKLQQIENQVESIKERQEEPSTTDSPTLSRSNTNKF